MESVIDMGQESESELFSECLCDLTDCYVSVKLHQAMTSWGLRRAKNLVKEGNMVVELDSYCRWALLDGRYPHWV